MNEIQKLAEALQIVEKYSNYLYRKAWGKVLVIWGALAPIGFFVILNAEIIAPLFKMADSDFSLVIQLLVILLGTSSTIYTFSTTKLPTMKTEKDGQSEGKFPLHAPVMFIIWLTAFYLPSILPESLHAISLLWGVGGACFISYIVLKTSKEHGNYPELLVTAAMLFLCSLPILFIKDDLSAQLLALILVGLCLIVAGFYFTVSAPKELNKHA
ncbi:MAG: hypothetical protein ACTSP4_11850 [Candidatus Hodarchaeales archaeon]